MTKRVSVLGFLILIGSFTVFGDTSYYDKNLAPEFKILEVYSHTAKFEKVEHNGRFSFMELSNNRQSGTIPESGSRQSGHFAGFVGVELDLPSTQWYEYGHYWKLDFSYAMMPTRGIDKLLIQCMDKDGDIIHTIELERDLKHHHLLGIAGNDIAEIDKLRRDANYPSIAIPKADGSDHSRSVVKVRLGVYLSEWRGALRIYNLTIKPFELSEDDIARWSQDLSNGIVLGANHEFFEPSYLLESENCGEIIEDSAAKLLRTIGMDRLRYFAQWDELEPLKGTYKFEELDKLIERLAYYDAHIGMCTLMGFPDWVSDLSMEDLSPELQQRMKSHYWNPNFPPSSWADYEEFVRILLTRYRDDIRKWEIWNEPNAHVFAGDRIQIYKQLLMRFHNVARDVSPDAEIICGRVGYWMPYLVQEGLADCMDAVASHPYNWKLVNELRTVMTACGVEKPIAITEVGYNGGGYPWTGPATFANEKDRAAAAETIIPERLAKYAMDREIYWYTPIQADRQYGLVQYLGDRLDTPPIYYTMGSLTKQLEPDESPVTIAVEMPNEPVKRGLSAAIKLIAENTSGKEIEIRFWPVGFVEGLGFKELEDVRKHDWRGFLLPGTKHEAVIEIKPANSAVGKYKTGLAVITGDNKNNVVLKELYISDPQLKAAVTASKSNNGAIIALNDCNIPVWSNDQDTDFLVWDTPDKEKQSKNISQEHWVCYTFEKPETVRSSKVYWYDNSLPDYPVSGLTYGTHSVPEDWCLEYKLNGAWHRIDTLNGYPVKINKFSEVEFDPVKSDSFRMKFNTTAGKGAGVGEWQLK
jgi:hypothetical protein